MASLKLTNFLTVIKSDLYRYEGAMGVIGFLKNYIKEPGFRYSFWMRMTAFLEGNSSFIIPYCVARLQQHRLGIKYGISIPHVTQIGPGLYIGHFGGIVVNPRVSIGHNCNLSHGVTIGQKNRGKYKGYPKIGDCVFIGPGVSIIGSVIIGSNVAIGANAVVVHDINDNEVAGGNPAKIISTKGAQDYINWTLNE